ncbi:ArsR/SmtB family transcription factor [Magnetofaba australis]|uniref:Putative ArsR family transcriptional regulator n=1 Tax=Magnetofaba australis IT-1 TaxID=1434232 RepID=A0A1Y2K8W3_9PROT|nr:metalloregulator ArsR/SmtB family transcription factor [Magnetofaba australis]OSM05126.1 putative ArsR family transcriptional regulator [Magnetofaba australis IT-1]
MKQASPSQSQEAWPALFKALSEPLRLRLLALIASCDEICVCDLIAVTGESQSAISRHLAYLKNSGWVTARRDGVWMRYRLSAYMPQIGREITPILLKHAPDDEVMADDLQRLRARASYAEHCTTNAQ